MMTTVNFKNCEGKEENGYMKAFAHFLVSRFSPQVDEIDVESPEEAGGRVDYFVPSIKRAVEVLQFDMLVEVKQVVNQEWQQNYHCWKQQVEALNREVESRDLTWVQGCYRVLIPFEVKLKSEKRIRRVVNEIFQGIGNGQGVIDISGIGGFEIYKPSRKKESPISFGGPTINIKSSDIMCQSIIDNIKKADKQLGSFEGDRADKRILLLVDAFFPGNVFPYPALMRNHYAQILDDYKNIDKIWLQVREPSLQHHLLFSRNQTREELESIWSQMEKKYLSEITSGDKV